MSYKKHHIFLSYSRRDTDMMRKVRDILRADGFLVWTDEHSSMQPGTPDWTHSIEQALDNVECLTLIATPDSKQSHWVREELNYAKSQNITIYVLLARGEESKAIPFGYTLSQRIDIRFEFDKGINTLIQALASQLSFETISAKRTRLDRERKTQLEKEYQEQKRWLEAKAKVNEYIIEVEELVKNTKQWNDILTILAEAKIVASGFIDLIELLDKNESRWKQLVNLNELKRQQEEEALKISLNSSLQQLEKIVDSYIPWVEIEQQISQLKLTLHGEFEFIAKINEWRDYLINIRKEIVNNRLEQALLLSKLTKPDVVTIQKLTDEAIYLSYKRQEIESKVAIINRNIQLANKASYYENSPAKIQQPSKPQARIVNNSQFLEHIIQRPRFQLVFNLAMWCPIAIPAFAYLFVDLPSNSIAQGLEWIIFCILIVIWIFFADEILSLFGELGRVGAIILTLVIEFIAVISIASVVNIAIVGVVSSIILGISSNLDADNNRLKTKLSREICIALYVVIGFTMFVSASNTANGVMGIILGIFGGAITTYICDMTFKVSLSITRSISNFNIILILFVLVLILTWIYFLYGYKNFM